MNQSLHSIHEIGGVRRAAFVPDIDAARAALDELHEIHEAFDAIIDMLEVREGSPDTLAHVGRGQFAELAEMLHRVQEEGGKLAEDYAAAGFAAMVDLLVPDVSINALSRDHMSALLHIVSERKRAVERRLERALRPGEDEE